MTTVLDATSDAEATQQPVGTDRLAVIVPVYNEQATVAELLRRLESQPCVSQIIIVDDGSTDDTWEELAPWRARASFNSEMPWLDRDAPIVAVVRHDKNRGKGRAIRTGLEDVTCSHVIIQDADLEYDPADINKLWDEMQTRNFDAVFGSRYLDNPTLQRGRWAMQSGVRFLNMLVRVFYGIKLTDEATCYKMFRASDLLRMNLECERFEFCPEVTASAIRMGLLLVEIPISYSPRSVAEGKKIRWSDGWLAAKVLLLRRMRWRHKNGH